MKKFFLLLAFLVVLLPAWGGITPKPAMHFSLIYQTEQHPALVPATSEQFQCSDNQCQQPVPLGEYGIQKLSCQTDKCFSIAHQYEPFQVLVLDFSDGVKRTSNIFHAPDSLRGSFKVYVQKDALRVEPVATPMPVNSALRIDAWSSLIIVLLLEMIAAWVFLRYTGKSFHALYAVALANIISMALSWQVLSHFINASWLAWVFCLLFETLFVWALNRKQLSLSDAFSLSIATNVTSYSVGMMLALLIAPYLY